MPQPAPPDPPEDEAEGVAVDAVGAVDGAEAPALVEVALAPGSAEVVPVLPDALLSAPALSTVDLVLSASGTTAGAAVPPFLKSVAYQPVPLS